MRELKMWAFCLVLACALWATPTRAQEGAEHFLAEMVIDPSVLICDTSEEVKQVAVHMESGKTSREVADSISGCGFLIHPMRMRIVAVATFDTRKAKYLIVRCEPLGETQLKPQYGLAARKEHDPEA